MARAERTGTRPFQKKDRPWKRGSDGNAFRLRQRSVLDLDCGRHVGGSGHSSSDAPFVPVMKTAEPGQRDHLRIIGRPWLNGTTGGSLLAQIVVGPVVMVVGEVFLEDALQMPFVEDNHVINGEGCRLQAVGCRKTQTDATVACSLLASSLRPPASGLILGAVSQGNAWTIC